MESLPDIHNVFMLIFNCRTLITALLYEGRTSILALRPCMCALCEPDSPDNQMSGLFCITSFQTRGLHPLAPLCGYHLHFIFNEKSLFFWQEVFLHIYCFTTTEPRGCFTFPVPQGDTVYAEKNICTLPEPVKQGQGQATTNNMFPHWRPPPYPLPPGFPLPG